MNPSRQVVAACLSFLIASPNPAFACGLFGARPETSGERASTGSITGRDRIEKLVAARDPSSDRVVKFYVGPRTAKVVPVELNDQQVADFAAQERAADAIHNGLPDGFKSRGIGIGAAPKCPSLKTKSGADFEVCEVTGSDWETLSKRYGLADKVSSQLEPHFRAWVDSVNSYQPSDKNFRTPPRGLYAAVIKVPRGASADVYKLGVKFTYGSSGDELIKELAADKWLEYLGSRDRLISFKFEGMDGKIAAALAMQATSDGDVWESCGWAVSCAASSGSDVFLKIPGADKIRLFQVQGGNAVFKNELLNLDGRKNVRTCTPEQAPTCGGAPQRQGSRIDGSGVNKALDTFDKRFAPKN
jgi:hypothetical protein